MPELREVFEMVTKQTEPDVDAWREQERRQRRTNRNRKIGALAIAAAIGLVAVVVLIRAVDEGTGTQPGGQGTTTNQESSPDPLLSITEGPLEPGRYIISTFDADFNASHRITIDVPEGYEGVEYGVGAGAGASVLKSPPSVPGRDTGVSLYDVGYAFADACDWSGTLSPISSADELVAALGGQQGLRPSSPTDVVVSGFDGTFMELTVPAQAKLDRCTAGRMQAWALTGDGDDWIWLNNPRQHDLLWILEVDGVPLVIDAFLAPSASAQDRAELLQMVDSIRIDPR
jgi:hypothetical protein